MGPPPRDTELPSTSAYSPNAHRQVINDGPLNRYSEARVEPCMFPGTWNCDAMPTSQD